MAAVIPHSYHKYTSNSELLLDLFESDGVQPTVVDSLFKTQDLDSIISLILLILQRKIKISEEKKTIIDIFSPKNNNNPFSNFNFSNLQHSLSPQQPTHTPPLTPPNIAPLLSNLNLDISNTNLSTSFQNLNNHFSQNLTPGTLFAESFSSHQLNLSPTPFNLPQNQNTDSSIFNQHIPLYSTPVNPYRLDLFLKLTNDPPHPPANISLLYLFTTLNTTKLVQFEHLLGNKTGVGADLNHFQSVLDRLIAFQHDYNRIYTQYQIIPSFDLHLSQITHFFNNTFLLHDPILDTIDFFKNAKKKSSIFLFPIGRNYYRDFFNITDNNYDLSATHNLTRSHILSQSHKVLFKALKSAVYCGDFRLFHWVMCYYRLNYLPPPKKHELLTSHSYTPASTQRSAKAERELLERVYREDYIRGLDPMGKDGGGRKNGGNGGGDGDGNGDGDGDAEGSAVNFVQKNKVVFNFLQNLVQFNPYKCLYLYWYYKEQASIIDLKLNRDVGMDNVIEKGLRSNLSSLQTNTSPSDGYISGNPTHKHDSNEDIDSLNVLNTNTSQFNYNIFSENEKKIRIQKTQHNSEKMTQNEIYNLDSFPKRNELISQKNSYLSHSKTLYSMFENLYQYYRFDLTTHVDLCCILLCAVVYNDLDIIELIRVDYSLGLSNVGNYTFSDFSLATSPSMAYFYQFCKEHSVENVIQTGDDGEVAQGGNDDFGDDEGNYENYHKNTKKNKGKIQNLTRNPFGWVSAIKIPQTSFILPYLHHTYFKYTLSSPLLLLDYILSANIDDDGKENSNKINTKMQLPPSTLATSIENGLCTPDFVIFLAHHFPSSLLAHATVKTTPNTAPKTSATKSPLSKTDTTVKYAPSTSLIDNPYYSAIFSTAPSEEVLISVLEKLTLFYSENNYTPFKLRPTEFIHGITHLWRYRYHQAGTVRRRLLGFIFENCIDANEWKTFISSPQNAMSSLTTILNDDPLYFKYIFNSIRDEYHEIQEDLGFVLKLFISPKNAKRIFQHSSFSAILTYIFGYSSLNLVQWILQLGYQVDSDTFFMLSMLQPYSQNIFDCVSMPQHTTTALSSAPPNTIIPDLSGELEGEFEEGKNDGKSGQIVLGKIGTDNRINSGENSDLIPPRVGVGGQENGEVDVSIFSPEEGFQYHIIRPPGKLQPISSWPIIAEQFNIDYNCGFQPWESSPLNQNAIQFDLLDDKKEENVGGNFGATRLQNKMQLFASQVAPLTLLEREQLLLRYGIPPMWWDIIDGFCKGGKWDKHDFQKRVLLIDVNSHNNYKNNFENDYESDNLDKHKIKKQNSFFELQHDHNLDDYCSIPSDFYGFSHNRISISKYYQDEINSEVKMLKKIKAEKIRVEAKLAQQIRREKNLEKSGMSANVIKKYGNFDSTVNDLGSKFASGMKMGGMNQGNNPVNKNKSAGVESGKINSANIIGEINLKNSKSSKNSEIFQNDFFAAAADQKKRRKKELPPVKDSNVENSDSLDLGSSEDEGENENEDQNNHFYSENKSNISQIGQIFEIFQNIETDLTYLNLIFSLTIPTSTPFTPLSLQAPSSLPVSPHTPGYTPIQSPIPKFISSPSISNYELQNTPKNPPFFPQKIKSTFLKIFLTLMHGSTNFKNLIQNNQSFEAIPFVTSHYLMYVIYKNTFVNRPISYSFLGQILRNPSTETLFHYFNRQSLIKLVISDLREDINNMVHTPSIWNRIQERYAENKKNVMEKYGNYFTENPANFLTPISIAGTPTVLSPYATPYATPSLSPTNSSRQLTPNLSLSSRNNSFYDGSSNKELILSSGKSNLLFEDNFSNFLTKNGQQFNRYEKQHVIVHFSIMSLLSCIIDMMINFKLINPSTRSMTSYNVMYSETSNGIDTLMVFMPFFNEIIKIKNEYKIWKKKNNFYSNFDNVLNFSNLPHFLIHFQSFPIQLLCYCLRSLVVKYSYIYHDILDLYLHFQSSLDYEERQFILSNQISGKIFEENSLLHRDRSVSGYSIRSPLRIPLCTIPIIQLFQYHPLCNDIYYYCGLLELVKKYRLDNFENHFFTPFNSSFSPLNHLPSGSLPNHLRHNNHFNFVSYLFTSLQNTLTNQLVLKDCVTDLVRFYFDQNFYFSTQNDQDDQDDQNDQNFDKFQNQNRLQKNFFSPNVFGENVFHIAAGTLQTPLIIIKIFSTIFQQIYSLGLDRIEVEILKYHIIGQFFKKDFFSRSIFHHFAHASQLLLRFIHETLPPNYNGPIRSPPIYHGFDIHHGYEVEDEGDENDHNGTNCGNNYPFFRFLTNSTHIGYLVSISPILSGSKQLPTVSAAQSEYIRFINAFEGANEDLRGENEKQNDHKNDKKNKNNNYSGRFVSAKNNLKPIPSSIEIYTRQLLKSTMSRYFSTPSRFGEVTLPNNKGENEAEIVFRNVRKNGQNLTKNENFGNNNFSNFSNFSNFYNTQDDAANYSLTMWLTLVKHFFYSLSTIEAQDLQDGRLLTVLKDISDGIGFEREVMDNINGQKRIQKVKIEDNNHIFDHINNKSQIATDNQIHTPLSPDSKKSTVPTGFHQYKGSMGEFDELGDADGSFKNNFSNKMYQKVKKNEKNNYEKVEKFEESDGDIDDSELMFSLPALIDMGDTSIQPNTNHLNELHPLFNRNNSDKQNVQNFDQNNYKSQNSHNNFPQNDIKTDQQGSTTPKSNSTETPNPRFGASSWLFNPISTLYQSFAPKNE